QRAAGPIALVCCPCKNMSAACSKKILSTTIATRWPPSHAGNSCATVRVTASFSNPRLAASFSIPSSSPPSRSHLTSFGIRLPGRPNGRTGWVSKRALGALQLTHLHAQVLDERRLRLTLDRAGRHGRGVTLDGSGRQGAVAGIHGPSDPSLIPGMPSHGRVRMKDSDVARLWSLLPVGTPLTTG